jgi:hypothetical protein
LKCIARALRQVLMQAPDELRWVNRSGHYLIYSLHHLGVFTLTVAQGRIYDRRKS